MCLATMCSRCTQLAELWCCSGAKVSTRTFATDLTRRSRTLPENKDGCAMQVRFLRQIRPSDIQICLRADGSEWLLGSGSFGEVCTATWHCDTRFQADTLRSACIYVHRCGHSC